MEGRSSWLRGEPGRKVTHGRQIGRDRFRVARPQYLSELLKESRISAGIWHLFFSISLTMILRRDFAANFGLFPAVYNEAERKNGRNLTENGYSPSSVLGHAPIREHACRNGLVSARCEFPSGDPDV